MNTPITTATPYQSSGGQSAQAVTATHKAISDEEARHQMNKEEAFRSGFKAKQQKLQRYIIPGPGGNGTF
jgi:hypothetical protein